MRLLRFILIIVFIVIATVLFFRTYRNPIIVPDEYPTIQAAVDAALPGDRIIVKRGVYEESVVITGDKNSIKVIARGNNVILDGSGLLLSPSGFTLEDDASNVKIKGFRIINYNNGVLIAGAKSCFVTKNRIYDNSTGILVNGTSTNNQIIKNRIYNNEINGIRSSSVSNNLYKKNTINNNDSDGILLSDSANERLKSNRINDNNAGIAMSGTD